MADFDPASAIASTAAQYGVDPDLANAIAQHGEGFGHYLSPTALSPAGAKGTMQLMPGTAGDMNVDPADPQQNIIGGVKYLAHISQQLGTKDPAILAAAYNAGPGAVQRYGGVPPYHETQNYVNRVTGALGPSQDDLQSAWLQSQGVKQVTPSPGGGVSNPATGEQYTPDPAHPGQYLDTQGQSYQAGLPPSPSDDELQTAWAKLHPATTPSQVSTTPATFGSVMGQAARGLEQAIEPTTGAGGPVGIMSSLFSGTSPALVGLEAAMGPAIGAYLSKQPSNTPEQIARLAGQFAPGALAAPAEGAGALSQVAQRVANVAAPVAGDYGAQQGAKAAGLGPQGQQVAGAVGAMGAGALTGIPGLFAGGSAAGIDAANPVTNGQALRATKYVSGLANKPDEQMASAAQSGLPVTLADLAGPRGVIAARANAIKSPATAEAVTSLANQRSQTLPDDYAQAFHDTTGIDPDAVRGDFANQIASARAALAPKYQAALSSPEPVMTPALADLAKRPAVQSAMKAAGIDLANQGKPDVAAGLTGEAAQTPQAIAFKSGEPIPAALAQKLGLAGGSPATAPAPTLEAWDSVKKALQGMADYQDAAQTAIKRGMPPPAGWDVQANQSIKGVTRDLTSALREASPEYGDILDQAGDYMKQRAAYANGQSHLFNGKLSPGEQADYLKDLSGPEQQAYQAGAASAISQRMGSNSFGPGTLSGKWVSEKLQNAFGDSAQNFTDRVQQLARLKANAQQMVGTTGSTTAPTGIESAAQDAALAHPMGNALAGFGGDFVSGMAAGGLHPVSGLTFAGLNLARKGVGLGVDKIRQLGMSQATQDEAGRLLLSQMTPEELSQRLKQIGGGTSALQGIALPAASAGYLGAAPLSPSPTLADFAQH